MTNKQKIIGAAIGGLAVVLIGVLICVLSQKAETKEGEQQVGLIHYSGKLMQRATKGDVKAQYDLGNCFYYGLGIEQSYEKAVEWFRKAAEQNFAPAQNDLGDCYHRGIGVEKDEQEAERWWHKASRIRE